MKFCGNRTVDDRKLWWWCGDGQSRGRGVGFWCEEVVSAIICFALLWFCGAILSCLNWLML